MSQFDIARRDGMTALRVSREWLTNPMKATLRYADLMTREMIGSRLDDTDDVWKYSLFNRALLVGRWAMAGFPVVTMGHRTAGAFMATRMKASDAEDFVRCPWPAFAIRLPTPLVSITDHGVVRDASLILVTSLLAEEAASIDASVLDKTVPSTHRWWYQILATGPQRPANMPSLPQFTDMAGVSLWGFCLGTNELGLPDLHAAQGFMRWDSQQTDDVDARTEELCRSLLIASCLYLTGDPRERAERASEGGVTIRERSSKKRFGDELPEYKEFEVHSSIKINLHSAVREYVEHGGSAPSVQTLVSGHWKRVHFGPKRAQTRVQMVYPYWRGDIDAPISTRTK